MAPQRLTRALATFAVAVATGSPGLAQTAVGWHVVRPGDTLEGITALYFGSSARWPEVHALNPQVANPHRLEPGERLRVELPADHNADAALLSGLSRQVEEQPTPIPWQDARHLDLLHERDGIRTGGDSSAELRMPDGSRFVVSEDSLFFLRNLDGRDPRAPRRQTVEVVVGQADVAQPPAAARQAARPSDVEIVVGTAATRPQPQGGELRARARRPSAGGAQVMLYEGAAKVAAAGAEVNLPRGTGTAIADGAPPAPPRPLLPAPQTLSPPAGAELPFHNPRLSWAPVPEAERYVVEVCEDAECTRLALRDAAVTGPAFQVARLAPGSYHWRIAAVDALGLDGYASAAAALTVTADVPAGPATVTGAIVASGPQAGFGERLALGVGATLAPALDPHPAGVPQRFVPQLDGQDLPLAQWAGPWVPGDHLAGGRVETDVAAPGAIAPLAFVYDPVPPTLELQVDTPEVLDAHGLDQQVDDPVPPRRSRLPKQVPVAWGSHGVRWLALLPKGDSSAQWTVEADRPQVFLWPAAGVTITGGGDPEVELATGQVARLVSTDEHTAVARLVMDVTETADGARLSVTAIDLVGNRTTREWALRPSGRR